MLWLSRGGYIFKQQEQCCGKGSALAASGGGLFEAQGVACRQCVPYRLSVVKPRPGNVQTQSCSLTETQRYRQEKRREEGEGEKTGIHPSRKTRDLRFVVLITQDEVESRRPVWSLLVKVLEMLSRKHWNVKRAWKTCCAHTLPFRSTLVPEAAGRLWRWQVVQSVWVCRVSRSERDSAPSCRQPSCIGFHRDSCCR